MSRRDFQGSTYAVAQLMALAKWDTEHGGVIKPARVVYATADDRIRLGDHETRLKRRVADFLARAAAK